MRRFRPEAASPARRAQDACPRSGPQFSHVALRRRRRCRRGHRPRAQGGGSAHGRRRHRRCFVRGCSSRTLARAPERRQACAADPGRSSVRVRSRTQPRGGARSSAFALEAEQRRSRQGSGSACEERAEAQDARQGRPEGSLPRQRGGRCPSREDRASYAPGPSGAPSRSSEGEASTAPSRRRICRRGRPTSSRRRVRAAATAHGK